MDFLERVEAGEIESLMAVPRLVRSSSGAARRGCCSYWEHEAARAHRSDLRRLRRSGGGRPPVIRALLWAHRAIHPAYGHDAHCLRARSI